MLIFLIVFWIGHIPCVRSYYFCNQLIPETLQGFFKGFGIVGFPVGAASARDCTFAHEGDVQNVMFGVALVTGNFHLAEAHLCERDRSFAG